MDYKYHTVSILFSLDTTKNPIRMISEIEIYYKRDGCVVALKSYCGNLFVCTLSDDDIVEKVMQEDHLYVGRSKCMYKRVETNITCIKVPLPYWSLTIDDINRMLRAYCNILVQEIEILHEFDTRIYYAIIEMRREVPTRLKSKCGYIDVAEIVD